MRFTFLLLFAAISVQAQSGPDEPIRLKPTGENFRRAMAIRDPLPRQVDTLIALSISYGFTNEDTCLLLGRRSVEISRNLADASIHAKALLELGDSYRIFGDLVKGEALLKEGKARYEALGLPGQVAQANNKLGALMKNRGDNEAAIKYYLAALETWETLKDTQNIIKPYINIGAVFKSIDRLDKAEEYNLKALDLAEVLNDNRAKMYVLNNQALNYNTIALRYLARADSSSSGAKPYRDSAGLFIHKALTYHERSLALAREMKDNISVIRSLMNTADVQITSGKYNEAIELLLEAEKMSEDVGAIAQLLMNKINMASAYRHLGQYKTAISYGEAASQLAGANAMERHQAAASDQLYQTYKQLGQFEKALEHHELFTAYQQKNGAAETNRAIAEVESKYQNVQQEKQILELEIANARIEKQKNYLMGGALILGILGFLGSQLIRIRRERNDKMEFAEALIFAQEAERKRIARDLHDGIGQSLLLLKKQMASTRATTLENQKMISETLEEVRSISRDLHPFQLEKFGLTAAINEVVGKIESSGQLFISKDLENVDQWFSAKSGIHLFRIIQEALSNILKHADATAAKVSLRAAANEIIVKVQDNGRGFDHDPTLLRSKSLGLRTMYERVAAIGGKLKIEKGSPKGTSLEVRIAKSSS